MLPKSLCFVDVETTGMSALYGRIIEIGIIRVENNKIVKKYSTLINPQTTLDPFIKSMTGISQQDLEKAPTFYSVKNEIKQILKDTVFVAHNVLFDYMFIKREFERLEELFEAKYFCSVKLSKKLYPKFKHHNLDSIIQRLEIKCKRRHRAFDDAKVVYDFYKHSLKKFGEDKISYALDQVTKRPSLPIGVSEEILDSLPQSCGVYIFYNKDNVPLYVGKSINIRERVLSHFANSKRESKDMKIAQNIGRIETIETAGELGALLLEATLVKKTQPLYNRQLRYAYKLLALKKVSTPQSYNLVSLENLQDIPIDQMNDVLGIFKSKKDLKSFLLSIAKQYNLCLKLLGLESTNKNCFNYHLNLCFGACSGKEMHLKYNLRFEEAFYKTRIKDWPFKGPIALKEKPTRYPTGTRKQEIFVVDKWCILGKIQSEEDSLDEISKDYLFDTDTYKILNRYLNASKDFEVFNLSSYISNK